MKQLEKKLLPKVKKDEKDMDNPVLKKANTSTTMSTRKLIEKYRNKKMQNKNNLTEGNVVQTIDF